MSKPSPRKLFLHLKVIEVDRFKKVDCKNYEDCLNHAAREDWPQFHCNSCEAYEKEVKPAEIRRSEMLYSLVIEQGE